MNDTFNIKRFWNVLKHDFFTVWTYPLMLLVIPMVFWGLLAIVNEEHFDQFRFWTEVATIISIAMLWTISCLTFRNFTKRKQRLDTMLLPASLLEKMVSRLVYCWLLPTVIMLLHCYIFWHLPIMEERYLSMTASETIKTFSIGIFIGEIEMFVIVFWSSVFSKFVYIAAQLAIALVVVTVIKYEGSINMLWFDGIVRFAMSSQSHMIICYSVTVALFGLVSVGLSYIILSKKQLR